MWFPPSCSLWNLNSSKLREIFDYLKKFEFNGGNDTLEKNKTHYNDFISLIGSWYENALSREQKKIKKPVGSVSYKKNLLDNIKKFIYSLENLNENEKKIMCNGCLKKLKRVINKFENNQYLLNALEQMSEFPADMLVPELIFSVGSGLQEFMKNQIIHL